MAFGGALASFVSAYNASVSAVDGQRGSQAGALAGNSLVFAVGSGLNRLADFQTAKEQVPSFFPALSLARQNSSLKAGHRRGNPKLRQPLLPDATFSRDQHRKISGRHLLRNIQCMIQQWGMADDAESVF